ncbi:MAG: orotidine-5'-phosphate decarboxylase [Gammaproteobacteria bacterium]|nr:orotidine-5'-phosphate decarboxylase [Gammaproteobacteria bacterium]MCK5498641.1 orotidine-5'-phosphate decarboxylase [Gammaproteobacteria bacterium]
MSHSRIIVPLDFSEPGQALQLVEKLQPDLCRLKVGKELFTKAGPVFVDKLIAKGFDVFLDLKFHDIPTTVAKACAVAADLGVWMVNIHASGGMQMMSLAKEALEKKSHHPLLIGVTILTSMNEETLRELGLQCSVEDQVMRLAQLSKDAGLDGVVCSAHEVKLLRNRLGKEFKLVTPGIRPGGSENDDQKRVMTPGQAIEAGSDYLVIGRPITQAEDPIQALKNIEEEIRAASVVA